MKKLIFLIPFLLFSFNVELTKIYKKYFIPKTDAIFIKTKANNLTFPFHYIKVPNGYILYGDLRAINYYLENQFYAPKDAQFENIEIGIINPDKIQYQIINKISKTYKNCEIKNIIFLTPDEEKIIFKPTYVTFKYKIILDCK